MTFDWDDANILHLARHDITPEEAEQVFSNGPIDVDENLRTSEFRFSVIGETNTGRILTVIATWREETVRIITGWDATKAHKAKYLQYKGDIG